MDKKYKIIYADPPWTFKTYSEKGKGKSPEKHYDVLSIEDIKKLNIEEFVDKDAVLFLWITYPHLKYAFDVINAWGFEYKTVAFTWIKQTKNDKWHIGCGFYTRANPEICLLATRGKTLKRKSKSVRNLMIEKVGEHSKKPDETYNRIEELFDGPYLELFARNKRKGWSSWGNEIDSDIDLEV